MVTDLFNYRTEKYAYPHFPWKGDNSGFYFPDFIIEHFIAESKKITKPTFERHLNAEEANFSPLNRHRLLIPEPQISWDDSCDLVIAAFEDFSPNLGEKAKEIINNSDRWKLNEAPAGEAAGCCHPANCETNSKPYAVIEYSYDGTINDAVYIAHELGHLIADDYIRESGFSYQDAKRHMAEVQAFFTQHVLYNYLAVHPDENLRQASQSHFVGEITRSLYSLPLGIGALKAEKSALLGKSENHVRTSYSGVLEEWLGEGWQKYEKAQRLFDHITDSQKRDNWGICDLHQHPMASIISTGLFLQIQQASQQQRDQMIKHLYGAEGPSNINDVMLYSNVENGQDLALLAKRSISYITTPLEPQQAYEIELENPPILNTETPHCEI